MPGFSPGQVSTVQRKSGPALLLTYTGDGPADPVTGKSVTDAFERYEFFKGGKLATLTLSGPKGADNVDPVDDRHRLVARGPRERGTRMRERLPVLPCR